MPFYPEATRLRMAPTNFMGLAQRYYGLRGMVEESHKRRRMQEIARNSVDPATGQFDQKTFVNKLYQEYPSDALKFEQSTATRTGSARLIKYKDPQTGELLWGQGSEVPGDTRIRPLTIGGRAIGAAFAPKGYRLVTEGDKKMWVNTTDPTQKLEAGLDKELQLKFDKLRQDETKLKLDQARWAWDKKDKELNRQLKERGVTEEQAKAEFSMDQSNSDLDRLIAGAEELMGSPALGRITGVVGYFPDWPGGEAADLRAMLNTLESQVAFSVLQNMRNASKTGGALGQVSEREIDFLKNNLAALKTSQSKEGFQRNLQKLIDWAEAAKSRTTRAYKKGWEKKPGVQPTKKAIEIEPGITIERIE